MKIVISVFSIWYIIAYPLAGIMTISNLSTLGSVGWWKDNRCEIIANDQGNRTTPSYVGFPEEGDRLIGDGAKNQANNNPLNTICDAKRFIGKKFNDPAVKRDIDMLPFKIKEGKGKYIYPFSMYGSIH